MQNYSELIRQNFDFPTKEFSVANDTLSFNGIPLNEVIDKFGAPFKFTYLPSIREKIEHGNSLFKKAIEKHNYQGKHIYSYCTKSSHYEFVLNETIKCGAHIETSSTFDMSIVKSLFEKGKINKETYILCNGFKRPLYIQKVAETINEGFTNCIPVLDHTKELDQLVGQVNRDFQVGIRVAADEEPNFEFYTSRLGIRYTAITDFYKQSIKPLANVKLKMLHFFINTGMRDTPYYWNELHKCIQKYCELKKICPSLDSIDIGGGLPIKTSLLFDFDYQYMIDEIVSTIKSICDEQNVPTPDIFTEFGSYTVGESGGIIYSVLDKKIQNDNEQWYMIDGSFITHLPDTWGLNQRFILLAINHWDKGSKKVNLGGLTCDSMDYYNSESHDANIHLPDIDPEKEPLYIGFFHTGAYQDALGGVGGLQHCLIPSLKHVLIDKKDHGTFTYELFREEQTQESMLNVLGY
ncbi:MAG: arginine decarboxylase [Cyclobacteriaceae bacterium]